VQDYDGVWFVQRGVVDLDMRMGLVKQLPFSSTLLRAPIGLTFPTDRALSEAATVFAELLRQWCAQTQSQS
jgi:LysR family pca operon transcriptional activator